MGWGWCPGSNSLYIVLCCLLCDEHPYVAMGLRSLCGFLLPCSLVSSFPAATSCLHRRRIARDICVQCWSSLTHGRKTGCGHTPSSPRSNVLVGTRAAALWRSVTWCFCPSLKGMSSVFFNKGENCIAAGRLFVEDSIHDQFVQKVVSSRLGSELEGRGAREVGGAGEQAVAGYHLPVQRPLGNPLSL